MSPAQRREMLEREHPSLSTLRQCALCFRGGRHCRASVVPASTMVLRGSRKRTCPLVGEIDRQYLKKPVYGSRRT